MSGEHFALTEAVFYILLSLQRPLHGYGIMQRVEELSRGRVRLAAGTLYGALATLVEKGWTTNARQIGLSGRTVRPRLMITCGVSGAIQFSACMNASEHIVAINSDANAPSFEVAHVGIVGDLYQIVPDLIGRLKEGLG